MHVQSVTKISNLQPHRQTPPDRQQYAPELNNDRACRSIEIVT